jgi:hypothetical protein
MELIVAYIFFFIFNVVKGVKTSLSFKRMIFKYIAYFYLKVIIKNYVIIYRNFYL